MKLDAYGNPMAFKSVRLEPCMNAKFVRAADEPDKMTVMVYGDIGFDVDGSLFDRLMRGGDPFESVELRINSYGGDAWTGVAIYNLLRASGYPINVVVDGIAASAASIIAMAGDEITVYPTSTIMIHDARAGGFGPAQALRELADRAEAMTETLSGIYVEKTGKPMKDVRAAMVEEREFKGREAVAFGLASRMEEKSSRRKNETTTVASVRRWLQATAPPDPPLTGLALRQAVLDAPSTPNTFTS